MTARVATEPVFEQGEWGSNYKATPDIVVPVALTAGDAEGLADIAKGRRLMHILHHSPACVEIRLALAVTT